MVRTLFIFVISMSMSGCFIHIGNHHSVDQHIERTLELETKDLSELIAITGAGTVEIIGSDTADKIIVQADIYTSDDLDYTLSLERKGEMAKLIAEHNTFDGLTININQGTSIDLVITMPSDMALNLDDGSGDVAISGLKNTIEIDDGSGDLSVDGGSSLKLEDGSGSLSISNLTGDMQLVDGSGSVYISNIIGDIRLDDGSGSTLIENTQGGVKVSDGSGDLVIKNVTGEVKVDDGSGDITIDGAGSLVITESGSGGLRIDNVKGKVVTG
jgi:hypothetical protein